MYSLPFRYCPAMGNGIARATCTFHKSSLHFRYIKRQNMNPFEQHFARVASVATSPL